MTKTSMRPVLALTALALAACGGRESSAAAPREQAERAPDGAPAAAAQAQAPVAAPSAQPGGAPAPAGQAAAPGAAAPASPAPAAPPTPAEKANQDRAAEILSQAERTAQGIRSLEADFTQTLTVPLLGSSQRS